MQVDQTPTQQVSQNKTPGEINVVHLHQRYPPNYPPQVRAVT